MSDSLERIKLNIERLCRERGWSQSRLAQEMGVGQPQVNKWLSGKHAPGIDALAKIADALSVPVDALLREGDPIKVVEPELSLYDLADKLRTRLMASALNKPVGIGSARIQYELPPTAADEGTARVPKDVHGLDLRHIPADILRALGPDNPNRVKALLDQMEGALAAFRDVTGES